MLTPLHSYLPAQLRQLGELLRRYAPDLPPAHRLAEIDANLVAIIEQALRHGWSCAQLAGACELAVASAATAIKTQISLVLTGVHESSAPTRDTAAVVRALLASAQSEIVLAGYAFYDARELFLPIVEKMRLDPAFAVTLIIDLKRKPGDVSLEAALAQRLLADFWKRHWPWSPRPKLLYDRRALALELKQRAVMHAKFVLIDQQVALITSANFTPAAHYTNIEVGVIVRDQASVQQLVGFVQSLRTQLSEAPFHE